jgi:hypothetical protein
MRRHNIQPAPFIRQKRMLLRRNEILLQENKK